MAIVQADIDIMNMSLGRLGGKQITLTSYNAGTRPEDVQCALHYAQTRDSLLRGFEWPFAKTRFRLVSSWATLSVYTTDHYVWQSALLYKCATAHTAGTFATDLAAAKWTLVSTVSAWVTLTAYALGAFVVNNAIYYKCILAHTSGDTDDEPGVGATTATYWVVETTKPTNDFGYNYDVPGSSLRLVRVINEDNVNIKWQLETNTILTDETDLDIVYIDQITLTTDWSVTFKEMMIVRLALNLLGPLTGMGSSAIKMRQLMLQELQLLQRQVRTIGKQEGYHAGNSDWNKARFTNGRVLNQVGNRTI